MAEPLTDADLSAIKERADLAGVYYGQWANAATDRRRLVAEVRRLRAEIAAERAACAAVADGYADNSFQPWRAIAKAVAADIRERGLTP